jgi:hypothetical protein
MNPDGGRASTKHFASMAAYAARAGMSRGSEPGLRSFDVATGG